PIYYQLLTLLVAFAPWSIFIGPRIWYLFSELRNRKSEPAARQGDKETGRQGENQSISSSPCPLVSLSPCSSAVLPSTSSPWAMRLLICWTAVWLVVFSLSA